MKKLTSLLLLLHILLMAQPKIEIENGDTYDWGKVEQTKGPLKTIIKIKNIGNEPLKIHSVKPGCGCTTAPLDKDVIQPGEYGSLDVTLQISKDAGRIIKGITLTTNDPDRDKLDILLKANVLIPISQFPKILTFGNISLKKDNIAKMVLSNNVDRDIKVLAVVNSPNDFTTNLKEGHIFKAGQDFTLEAYIKANSKIEGTMYGTITIETDDPTMHYVSIKVMGTVDPGAN